MADILIRELTNSPPHIVFADHTGGFTPTVDLRHPTATPTNVQFDFGSISDGGARQSTKFSFTTPWAPAYACLAALEFAATGLTAQLAVEFFMGPSSNSVAANGNLANLSGSDGNYTGYSANLDDSVYQLDRIGTFSVTGDSTTTVQAAFVGIYRPKALHGILVGVT